MRLQAKEKAAIERYGEDDPRYDPRRSQRAKEEVLRMPLIHVLPVVVRGHIVAMLGELIGTFLFLFFAFAGTQAANSTQGDLDAVQGSSTSIILFICLSFGFSLVVNVWTFFRVSGGLFNPAVSPALSSLRNLGNLRSDRAARTPYINSKLILSFSWE